MLSITTARYVLLACANAVLAQLAIELGRGQVPLPRGWEWAVPLLSVALVSLTAMLPKVRRSGD